MNKIVTCTRTARAFVSPVNRKLNNKKKYNTPLSTTTTTTRARARERLLFVSLTSSSIHKKKNNSNNKESEIPTPSIVLSVCENTNVDGVQVFAGLSPASPPSSSSALITYKSMGNIPSFTSRKERKPLFFPSARSLIPITSI